MKYRYIVVQTGMMTAHGTNDRTDLDELVDDDDNFVIDVETGKVLVEDREEDLEEIK